jgi:hypothetical protein
MEASLVGQRFQKKKGHPLLGHDMKPMEGMKYQDLPEYIQRPTQPCTSHPDSRQATGASTIEASIEKIFN